MLARLRTAMFALSALILCSLALPAAPAHAQASRCFPETNQCIAGPIRDYWEKNGGLPIFGFPITEQRQETVEGRTLQVQWFERDRIEIQLDGSVTTGRLGVDRLAQMGSPWQQGNKLTPDAGCTVFRETGHQVCGQFRTFWERNGGLSRLGLPLTGEFQTTIEGKSLTVQYFERRRFELHNGNQVLLGLLGREVLEGAKGSPGGGQGQGDPCAGVPDPVNARIRPGKCFEAGTNIAIDVFGFRPNEQVGFWFNTPGGEIFGTIQTYNVGPTGAVNDLPLDTEGFIPGIWSFVMEGTRSGNKSIAYFRILGDAPQAPPPVSGGVPAPVNASVSPSEGPAGTTFEFQGFGFRAGENIGVYITAPDQSVFGAPFQVRADGSGASEFVTFRTASDFPRGIYAITFEGVSSKHRAIAYFRVQ